MFNLVRLDLVGECLSWHDEITRRERETLRRHVQQMRPLIQVRDDAAAKFLDLGKCVGFAAVINDKEILAFSRAHRVGREGQGPTSIPTDTRRPRIHLVLERT